MEPPRSAVTEDANDIRVGKVLLLTSRAVGRVLSVEKASDGLRVILGPVEITEVIRDREFNFNQPIDLTQGLSFARPELFDPPRPIEPLVARLARPERYGMFVRPVALMQGKKVTQHTDGVRFLGEAVLYVKTPELHFVLEIKGGKVIVAEVELSGVAGLLLSFEAGMPRPTDANLNAVRPADSDWAIPLFGLKGVPFAINVRQLFSLQTAFTSTGALKARGYYVLKGEIKAGYRDGRFGVGGPTDTVEGRQQRLSV